MDRPVVFRAYDRRKFCAGVEIRARPGPQTVVLYNGTDDSLDLI
jgi:hypothetical protein